MCVICLKFAHHFGQVSAVDPFFPSSLSKYTIGALLLAFLLRQFCALRRRQHLKKLIQRRQQELKDSRARLELKYPNPTPKQAAVAALDLPDIKEKLRDGSLTVEEVPKPLKDAVFLT